MTMTEQLESIKKLIDAHCARSEYLNEEYFYLQLENLCKKMSNICIYNLKQYREGEKQ